MFYIVKDTKEIFHEIYEKQVKMEKLSQIEDKTGHEFCSQPHSAISKKTRSLQL